MARTSKQVRSYGLDLEGIDKTVWNTFELAEFLGRSPGAVRNLVMRRAVPYRKLAGRLVFLKREILAWVEKAPGLKLEDLE